MNGMIDGIEPENVYKEYVSRGEEWADKRGAYELKKDLIKVVRAKMFIQFKNGRSAAEATEMAFASPEHEEAIRDSAEAGRLSTRAQVRWIATQALFEARRTSEASHRAANRVQA